VRSGHIESWGSENCDGSKCGKEKKERKWLNGTESDTRIIGASERMVRGSRLMEVWP